MPYTSYTGRSLKFYELSKTNNSTAFTIGFSNEVGEFDFDCVSDVTDVAVGVVVVTGDDNDEMVGLETEPIVYVLVGNSVERIADCVELGFGESTRRDDVVAAGALSAEDEIKELRVVRSERQRDEFRHVEADKHAEV